MALPKLATLIVKLMPAQKQQLERVAAEQQRTMSVIVRIALAEYLERAGEDAKVVQIRQGYRPEHGDESKAS